MIEAPEALCLSEQLNRTVKGKKIACVVADFTPHKFAWYYGNPESYNRMMAGKVFGETHAYGGLLETEIEDMRLLLGDGMNLRYYYPGEKIPSKHQLLIGFEDDSFLTGAVRMYGCAFCFPADSFESNFSSYRDGAKNKRQVMSDDFNLDYFLGLINSDEKQNKSAKAFLATEQTIPGVGNGVLQDILFNARIHPKTRINTLSEQQKEQLFHCVKSTLKEIYQCKGRHTESDLFGKNGTYISILSKDTNGKPCPVCGEAIRKESFLGGSIYYCFECQK